MLCSNSVLDFCLWAPPKLDDIANTEGEEVAWCTKKGHGSRLIPAGALTGVQYMKTPDYVQVVGFIDQTKINIQDGDGGGEQRGSARERVAVAKSRARLTLCM